MSRPFPHVPGRLANWTRATPLGALATRWARLCAERRGVPVIAATDTATIVELTRKRTGQLHAWDSGCPREAHSGRDPSLTSSSTKGLKRADRGRPRFPFTGVFHYHIGSVKRTRMTRSTTSRLTTLLAAIAVSACASTHSASEAPVTPTVSARLDPAYVAKARADSIRHPYTQADADFMSHMIGHHAQAIAMSRWAPTHGASAAVLRLADRIINAQQDEIATMQTWLRDRLQPIPEATPNGMKMTMNGMEHMMLMPGMLTEAQMKQLDAARGPEFDRLFLTFMIQHHRGAVSMVKDLFGTYGAGQDETVFKFASDVNVDQTTEIVRMEKMLAAINLGITVE